MIETPSCICAPDSFKGTVDASAAAAALAVGIREYLPIAEVVEHPMADGGEGTMEALFVAQGGTWREVQTIGPRESAQMQDARWLLSGSGSAVVELAESAGLTLLEPSERDPEQTSSYGVGQLLRSVLEEGVSRVILALGGSATVDGGVGLLQALGAVPWVDGRPLERPFTGADLLTLEELDLRAARQRLEGVQLIAAVDVTSPLLGEQGAACLFGPQKGADADAVGRLEQGLRHLSNLMGDPGLTHGDGAAGGAGYGLRVGLGGEIQAGAPLIAEVIGLPAACQQADLVVTGEGRYDDQSRLGKVPWEVARLAQASGARCALVAGSIQATESERATDPFNLFLALVDLDVPAETSHVDRLQRAGFQLAQHLLG